MKKLATLLLSLSFSVLAATEKTIHVDGSMSVARTWMEYTKSEELNIRKLLELLARSETGAALIEKAETKAMASGKKLIEVIKAGEGSLTDTTLVRKFSPETPDQVEYETRSLVYINRNHPWDDALLDLAHELTHFVYRDAFNPYAEDFNVKDFIKSTIEGKGGEAQAFIVECKVLSELFKSGVTHGRTHCQSIKDEDGRVSLNKAVELFYHVGPYYDTFHKQLSSRKVLEDFHFLKADKINFISSAYGLPYPVAALMEFDLVMTKVCENDRRRLSYYQSGSRGPASENTINSEFIRSYNNRCK
ncbi:MAG: hypothetical protein WDA09_05025 [Bacteriovoracaceae bacterium]